MTSAERIYALLVEANPIPDPNELPEPAPRLAIARRSSTMQVHTAPQPTVPQRSRRLVPMLSAVALLIVALVAIVFFTSGGDETASRESAAVATVEEFYDALRSGDLAAIERLTNGDEAEMRMWEFNAVGDATYPRDVIECAAVDSANSLFVAVECTVNPTAPVFIASGVTQWVEPWHVFDGGDLRWRPIEGPSLGAPLRAVRDYLRAEHASEYAEHCDPSGFTFGEVIFNEGVSLTPQCAALLVPLMDEIAASIEAGAS